MFSISIRSPLGLEGDFTVFSPVLALDLALTAQRAGLTWRASGAERSQNLTLGDLRGQASEHVAARPDESLLLQDVELRHDAAVRSNLS